MVSHGDTVSALEQEAARALNLDPSRFVRSQLAVEGSVVATSTSYDAGGVETYRVPHQGKHDHTVGMAVLACCFGVAGRTAIELAPSAASPRTGPVLAKYLAYAFHTQAPKEGILIPAWDQLIRDRDDFAHLGLQTAHWTVEAGRARFTQALLSPVPFSRDTPTVAYAFYVARLIRSADRHEKLRSLNGPAVILENEVRMLRGNVEQLERRGYWGKAAEGLPERVLATVREALGRTD